MWTEREGLPEGLLQRPAGHLHEVLDGPTLIHLPGRMTAPLAVTVLLHGNEDTGWEAVRALLQRHAGRDLPRALSLFIGNVAAAREGVRHLEGQPDYNRVWRGEGTPEHTMMAEVVAAFHRRQPFASIDIHNNTGINPHYGCVNILEPHYLHLATLFSRTVVYFRSPATVQSRAMSRVCPAVTVECGRVGQSHGVDHAVEFLEAALQLTALPEHPPADHDYDLYHTVATVRVPDGVAFTFGEPAGDLSFLPDLDRLNFRELPAGTTLAQVRTPRGGVAAWSEAGERVTDRYFETVDGELRTRLTVMPSMLSTDAAAVRDDCLCYLMERLDHNNARHGGRAFAPDSL